MLLLTCEHASCAIPSSLSTLFQGSEEVVQSHRGWDKGALFYAKALSSSLQAPLFITRTSRLLVDTNRSLHHTNLFSEYTKNCASCEKKRLIQIYWLPFRKRVISAIEAALQRKETVYHVSCHTFTPELNGVRRACDIGLLYDPRREKEVEYAHAICQRVRQETALHIRMNYPYRGISDGHVQTLRHFFSRAKYVGIEIEVNQSLLETEYWKIVGIPALSRAIDLK